MTSDRKSLIAAARELNDLLELDPKIKVVAVKTDELETKIKETAKLFEEGDEISAELKSVFDGLEVKLPEFVKVLDPVDPPKEKKEEKKEEEKKEESKNDEGEGEVTTEALVELAGEMNTIMGLEPEIDTDLPYDELKAEVIKNCYDDGEIQIFDTDEFTEGALASLKIFGIEPIVTAVRQNDGKKSDKKDESKKGDGKKDSGAKKDKESKKKESKAPKEKSNKRIVFDAWKDGKGETDIEKLLASVDGQVKSNTVKIWLNNWKNGKNLPAGAK